MKKAILVIAVIVEPVDEADIASQIVGRVVEVRVRKGDAVEKGDLLVKLDDTDAKARLDSVRARIQALTAAKNVAAADWEKAKRDFDRFSQLAPSGASTQSELDDSQTTVEKTKASLERCEHELRESEATRREGPRGGVTVH